MWMTRVAINNPVFATMMMVAVCVLGLFSYLRLGVEQMPDINPPVVFVSISYPGASPSAVETEITKPVESALNSIAGVKMIRSNSLEGRSETVVEFNLDADISQANQDVREKIAALQASLPEDAKPPFISRFDNDNAQPTVVLALVGHHRSERELSLLADQTVVKRLERAEGVARVVASGLNVRQVRVELDPARLRAAALVEKRVEFDQIEAGDAAAVMQHLHDQMRLPECRAPRHGRADARRHVRIEEIDVEAHMQKGICSPDIR